MMRAIFVMEDGIVIKEVKSLCDVEKLMKEMGKICSITIQVGPHHKEKKYPDNETTTQIVWAWGEYE